MVELSERDRAMLDFEARFYRYPGVKEQAIRDEFDLSATRYFQQLNKLAARPEALAYAPLTVKRLIRRRVSRVTDRRARVGH